MTRLLAVVMSCLFVFSLGISEADARRFGGGGSSGNFSRQAAPTPNAPSRQTTQPGQQQQGAAPQRSGFGGMLMGLAAGGLLAALFLGGGFDGIQFFDILLLVLVVGGLFIFLRRRRQRQLGIATAGGAYVQEEAQVSVPQSSQRDSLQAFAGHGQNAIQGSDIRYGAPTWFNEAAFLETAHQHFLDLQAAWDANDLCKIEEYVTPQLYQFLCEERQREVGEVKTEVHQLAAEMTNIQQINEVVELAVMFHGVMSESGAPETAFCEIWHLVRDMRTENAPWLIQGIEQVE